MVSESCIVKEALQADATVLSLEMMLGKTVLAIRLKGIRGGRAEKKSSMM